MLLCICKVSKRVISCKTSPSPTQKALFSTKNSQRPYAIPLNSPYSRPPSTFVPRLKITLETSLPTISISPSINPKSHFIPDSYFPLDPIIKPFFLIKLPTHPLFKSLHHKLSNEELSLLKRPHHPSYFNLSTSTHIPFWLWKRFHFHFSKRISLNNSIFFTPRPPFLLWQISFHFTQANLLISLLPSHKNRLCIPTSLGHTTIEILKKERKNSHMDDRTEFIKQTLPQEKYFYASTTLISSQICK